MNITSNLYSGGKNINDDFLDGKTTLVFERFTLQNVMNFSQTLNTSELSYEDMDDFKIIFESLSLKIITGILFIIVSTLKNFQDILLIQVIHR